MRKIIFILSLSIIIGVVPVFATEYEPIILSGYYKVIKVIDGETFEVEDVHTGDKSRVQLSGLNTKGYPDTYLYMQDLVLGQEVYLYPDLNLTTKDRYSLVTMEYNNQNINEFLLRIGFAEVDKRRTPSTTYRHDYVYIEDTAKNNNAGMWLEGYYDNVYNGTYNYNGININTATASQLASKLSISQSSAKDIINYREKNPFNFIEELKFVNGITWNEFNSLNSKITVATNIRTASKVEIAELIDISDSDAVEIMEYRDAHKSLTWKDLYKDRIISSTEYNKNIDFVTTSNEIFVNKIYIDKSININTATQSQIDNVGFTTSEARAIVRGRNGYSYKTKEEIREVENLNITIEEFNNLEDNFNVMTNINTCSKYELESLFSEDSKVSELYDKRPFGSINAVENIVGTSAFEKVEDYIYVDKINKYKNDYININTASYNQLADLGLSSSSIEKIRDKNINNYNDMPVSLNKSDMKITLFTNINKASVNELKTLSSDLSTNMINKITNYRSSNLIATDRELKEIFTNAGEMSVYNKIERYVVYR
ncbi:MAG: helix-hairpin-helix domain-containing protein [Lachnospirales bacterium]